MHGRFSFCILPGSVEDALDYGPFDLKRRPSRCPVGRSRCLFHRRARPSWDRTIRSLVASRPNRERGFAVWFTGLPGAGKTTAARLLEDRLRASGAPVEVLDGDLVRTRLSKGLGFTKEDRDENV